MPGQWHYRAMGHSYERTLVRLHEWRLFEWEMVACGGVALVLGKHSPALSHIGVYGLKSRIPIFGIATGTLGDEKYQAAVSPSPSTGSGQAPPRGLGRWGPNRRAPSRPLRTAVGRSG